MKIFILCFVVLVLTSSAFAFNQSHLDKVKNKQNCIKCDLSGAKLDNLNLRGADLRGADLRGARLYGANLRGADLRGANMSGANLLGVRNLGKAHLRNANLTGASLRYANLRSANLRDVNLTGARLFRANLRGATLRDVNLTGARLYSANLRGATLRDVNLTGVKISERTDLRGARGVKELMIKQKRLRLAREEREKKKHLLKLKKWSKKWKNFPCILKDSHNSIAGCTFKDLFKKNTQEYLKIPAPFGNDPHYVNFEYEKPIYGMKISGVFRPMLWGCSSEGFFKGESIVHFTRLSDGKSFEFYIDKVSFANATMCKKEDDPEYDKRCTLKNNIILKHDPKNSLENQSTSFQIDSTSPIQIMDIDFDGKKEIILHRPCGTRTGSEYEAYDFKNTKDAFDINRRLLGSLRSYPNRDPDDYGPRNDSFHFLWSTTFNKRDKTVTQFAHSGVCGGEKTIHKSDGKKGFNILVEKESYERIIGIDPVTKRNDVCVTKNYKVVGKKHVCKKKSLYLNEKWVDGNWVTIDCKDYH